MTPFPFTPARLQAWAVSSQQQARRNAMIAATQLAQRRAERLDVEHYLAELERRRTSPAEAAGESPAPAAHA